MHICFVDESGTPAKPGRDRPRYFVFGGVVIPEEQWHDCREKFIGLKRNAGYRGEVKWRYFAAGNTDNDNPMAGWSMEQRDSFRASVFKIITGNRSIKLLAGVCQAECAYKIASIREQEDIYFGTYKVVTERFQYLLQDISRESGRKTSGIIVSDHRNNNQDTRMRLQHERLVRETGRFTSTYGNFIEGIFLTPSHMSIGVQLADMVAGAVWRYHEHGDERWINPLKPSFRCCPQGKIDGFGVMRFPKAGWTGPLVTKDAG